jgi:hypothetical protein
MTIDGKVAICVRLHCPQQCGGFIENEILMYLLEGDELYIYGVCSECGSSGNLTVPLNQLLLQVPTVGPVM